MPDKWYVPAIILSFTALLAACGNHPDNPYGPNRGPHTQNMVYQGGRSPFYSADAQERSRFFDFSDDLEQDMRSQAAPSARQHTLSPYNRPLSDQLVDKVDAIPGVAGTSAIVYGKHIVIGINTRFDESAVAERAAIEQQALAAARAIAPNHTVRVTSSSAKLRQIRHLDFSFRVNSAGDRTASSADPAINQPEQLRDNFLTLVRDLDRMMPNATGR